jgi:hypothetical protein
VANAGPDEKVSKNAEINRNLFIFLLLKLGYHRGRKFYIVALNNVKQKITANSNVVPTLTAGYSLFDFCSVFSFAQRLCAVIVKLARRWQD